MREASRQGNYLDYGDFNPRDPPGSCQTSSRPGQLHLLPNASDFVIDNLTIIQSRCPSIGL
jgi:hypothetical protein